VKKKIVKEIRGEKVKERKERIIYRAELGIQITITG